MHDTHESAAGWKHRLFSEMVAYWILVLYLAVFFGFFTWYRRLILETEHIPYLHYGVSLIQALVLAKVVLIGDVFRLGRRFEDKPLVVPTLYKAAVFSLWVGAFGVLEHAIAGWVHGHGFGGGLAQLSGAPLYELLARCLIIFVAFVPFFAFTHLERVLAQGELRALFFQRGAGSK